MQYGSCGHFARSSIQFRYFYNNGITMTCSQFRHNALHKKTTGWCTLRPANRERTDGPQFNRYARGRAGSLKRAERAYPHDGRTSCCTSKVLTVTVATEQPAFLMQRDLEIRTSAPRGVSASRFDGRIHVPRQATEDRAVCPTSVTNIADPCWRSGVSGRIRRGSETRTFWRLLYNGCSPETSDAERKRSLKPCCTGIGKYAARDLRPLAYGSRFSAKLMGASWRKRRMRSLNLRTATSMQARNLVRTKIGQHLEPERQIAEGLPAVQGKERTLQRLSGSPSAATINC